MPSVTRNFALWKGAILSNGTSRNSRLIRLVLFLRGEVCVPVIYLRVAFSNEILIVFIINLMWRDCRG